MAANGDFSTEIQGYDNVFSRFRKKKKAELW
jgi:hypothetical protein